METTSLQTREPELVTTTGRERDRVIVPRADILETAHSVVVLMDVPGASEENIDITLEKDLLTVSARVADATREDLELAWSEYNPTVFRRQFSVSDRVDGDGVTAQLRHGVLRVELNKSERAQVRKIEVRS